MLRGVASVRCGSKRLGIHSHSWQSRKKVRTALSWVDFVAASRMLGLQPPPDLEQGGADGAADPGCER